MMTQADLKNVHVSYHVIQKAVPLRWRELMSLNSTSQIDAVSERVAESILIHPREELYKRLRGLARVKKDDTPHYSRDVDFIYFLRENPQREFWLASLDKRVKYEKTAIITFGELVKEKLAEKEIVLDMMI